MTNSVKIERTRLNLTQEELSNKIGVSRQTVNSIEKGRYVPSTELALRLSGVFGLSVNDLFSL